MANITWDDVVKLAPAPELEDPAVDTDLQTELLKLVNSEILNVRIFGGSDSAKYKLARVYIAAHFASLSPTATASGGTSGTVGPITSESEGGISRSYGDMTTVPGSADSSWAATIYGQKYAMLARTTLSRLPFLNRRS